MLLPAAMSECISLNPWLSGSNPEQFASSISTQITCGKILFRRSDSPVVGPAFGLALHHCVRRGGAARLVGKMEGH